MDRFNRGETYESNGRISIEFYDEYEHQSDDIEYVIENVLQNTNTGSPSYEPMRQEFNSIYENRCFCSNSPPFEICTECVHGDNYVAIQTESDNQMELVLKENRKSHDLVYECCDLCTCPSTCANRLVQYGPRKHLQIMEFPQKQFGLITLKSIPDGAFICEYAGELLTHNEALRRQQHVDETDDKNYLICLNERTMSDGITQIKTFVDASRRGNVGRYLNHSCEPNCQIISCRTNGSIPKLAIFAQRQIAANEELCYDYGVGEDVTTGDETNRKLCFCGSAKCRKYLPILGLPGTHHRQPVTS